MRTIYESESTPKADGFFMPAEFAPQDRVWMGWPHRTDTWSHGAKPAQRQYAAIARAIADFTPVTVCANQADYANCKAVFEEDENITVIEMTSDDAWFRDTGATFVIDGRGGKRACNWRFNAYGGLIDGLYFPWDKDEQIALKMAELAGCRRYRPDAMILEGGSIAVDGEGIVVVTDQCLLSLGRTCSALMAQEPQLDSAYPSYEQCRAAYETLAASTDAKGRLLKVHKLSMPAKPLFMDQSACDTIDADENAEPRVADEPLIASYMNYLVTNHGVIVP